MTSKKITNLVIDLRAGVDVSERAYKIFKDDFSSFEDLEFFQDFEELKSLTLAQILSFRARKCGFIYVADCDAGVVKVGRSKNVAQREKTLNSAGVLDELIIRNSWFVFDAPMVEAYVHKFLGKKYPKKKEFFLGCLDDISSDVASTIQLLMEETEKKLDWFN